MPEKSPPITDNTAAKLQALGARVAQRRKALRLSATVAAEAAGLSRVTLHRIEKGEPSVTMGAWSNVIGALGMHLQAKEVRLEQIGNDIWLHPELPQEQDMGRWLQQFYAFTEALPEDFLADRLDAPAQERDWS